MYWMRNDITLPPRRASAKPRAARHLGVLVVILFALIGVRLWIVATASLLYSTTGPLLGASYTDVHVALPGLYVSAIAALIAAAWVAAGIVRGKLIWSAISATVFYAVIKLTSARSGPGGIPEAGRLAE